MIAIIAAAPGPLLDELVAECRQLAPTERWSPLAVPACLGRAPGGLGRFARRHVVEGAHTVPALLAADFALRGWAGAATDRRYLADFARRVAIDAWAAGEIRRRRPRVVIAGSLAARRTFAAARTVGARTVLVLDVPLLRALHRDLDHAAAVWPARRFLQRFRAPSWAIARQEAERVLADLVLVRGAYAHALCVADGIAGTRLARLPSRRPPVAVPPSSPTGRLRLAGLAAARHGVDTALAAARALGMKLVVRIAEGSEPTDLARHPTVVTGDAAIDAIVCPAICETYAPELASVGIPVIASPMASRDGDGPDPFAPEELVRAVERALAGAPPKMAPIPPLGPRLAALL